MAKAKTKKTNTTTKELMSEIKKALIWLMKDMINYLPKGNRVLIWLMKKI